MAKRSIELQPLSRQHHNGLFFCLLLEKGFKKNADRLLMKDFCMFFWETDLQHHFELEEKHLQPLMMKHSELIEGITRMMLEHAQIKELFSKNAAAADDDVF